MNKAVGIKRMAIKASLNRRIILWRSQEFWFNHLDWSFCGWRLANLIMVCAAWCVLICIHWRWDEWFTIWRYFAMPSLDPVRPLCSKNYAIGWFMTIDWFQKMNDIGFRYSILGEIIWIFFFYRVFSWFCSTVFCFCAVPLRYWGTFTRITQPVWFQFRHDLAQCPLSGSQCARV